LLLRFQSPVAGRARNFPFRPATPSLPAHERQQAEGPTGEIARALPDCVIPGFGIETHLSEYVKENVDKLW